MNRPLYWVSQGEGDGTPLVLLHGFGGEAASWIAVQTALAGRRQVFAIDLPGHGKSRFHPANGYSGMAQAVIDTLDHLSVQRFHLAAHSMGGAVATTLALNASSKIASLTLICPGGFGGLVNEKLMHRFATSTSANELQDIMSQFFSARSIVPRHLGAHLAAAREEPAVTERLNVILSAMLDGPHQVPAGKERLHELACSIRVLWGDHDQVQSEATIANLPSQVALHRFADAGHMVHVEKARQVAHILRLQMLGE